VVKTEVNDSAYECTKQLFDHWLRSSFDENRLRAPFDQAHFNASSRSSSEDNAETESEENSETVYN
jgi:hypothetical protein